MVKSLKFLVFLIAIAVLGAMSPIQAKAVATAPKDVVFVLYPNPDNITCEDTAVYISKQLLPSTGLSVVSSGVKEDNATNPDAFLNSNGEGINAINGSANNMTFTFSLTNGTYANNLVLVLDNGSIQTVVAPDFKDASKVQFTLNDAALDTNDYKYLHLYDKNASDNYTNPALSINVDGSLNDGDKVNLSLTTTYNGKHLYNGCFNKVIYVVENQWSAQLCCCKDNTPDKDALVATDSGVTVMDTESKVMGMSLYNSCSYYKNKTHTTSCCTEIDSTCGLFCNESSTTTTSTDVSCSMPGECVTPGECTKKTGYGLNIVENNDFTNHSSYKVNSLYNTPVTFTLTGNLKNIASIQIVSSADGNPNAFVQPAVLGTFAIDNDTTATVTIPGSTLFVKSNGGVQKTLTTPIHFKVEIKPKDGASLMPNKFYLSAVMEASSDLANPQNLGWGEIIDWSYDLNSSYVFMAPYLRSDSAVSSVIRFENADETTAAISLYVNDPDGNSWTFVKHITLAAGASTVVSGADFINYAAEKGLTLDGTKGFAVYGIANVTSDRLTVYGSQQYKGTTDFRPLPIDVIGDDGIRAGQ